MKRAVLAQLLDDMPIDQITKAIMENFDAFSIDAIRMHLQGVAEKARKRKERERMRIAA